MPTNWWGRQNAVPLRFDPKPLEAVFSAVFELNKCRAEAAGDVISGKFVGPVVPDSHVW